MRDSPARWAHLVRFDLFKGALQRLTAVLIAYGPACVLPVFRVW